MLSLESLLRETDDKLRIAIEGWNPPFIPKVEKYLNSCNLIKKKFQAYKKSGKYVSPFESTTLMNDITDSSTVDENEPRSDIENKAIKKRGRPSKSILVDNSNLRPTDLFEIKKERISDVDRGTLSSIPSNIKIKEEKEMPAPTQLPPRRKKIKVEAPDPQPQTRMTRTKKKKQEEDAAKQDTATRKYDSDIIPQDTTVTTIDLVDSDTSVTETSTKRPTRTRKTKKPEEEPALAKKDPHVQESSKRSRKNSREDASEQINKKSRSGSASKNLTGKTEYEDAASTLNETYVTTSPKPRPTVTIEKDPTLNATMVVANPKFVISNKADDELLTDDDSDVEYKKKLPNKAQIFDPLEESPVKKKIQAFEKLGNVHQSGGGIPVRKAPKSKQQNGYDNIPQKNDLVKNTKNKFTTPVMSKTIPKGSNTTGKTNRHLSGLKDDSIMNGKSASALKVSQAEYIEREKQREIVALKKKEALLRYQTEEKRKKREEKHLKAQEQREIMEREKQKLLEQHRLKEERTKQLIAEKEEKLQKQREMQEKKRILAKEKAMKQKEMEEALIQEQKQTKKIEKAGPIFMITKAPYLPTDDCYDSDAEEYGQKKLIQPTWFSTLNIYKFHKFIHAAGEKRKNTFFCMQPHTIDLSEVFENINPLKLKRTSSAIWKKPPRYTLMPLSDQPDFEEEYDSDEI